MTVDPSHYRYRFKVLGRYEATVPGNEPQVTLSVLAGRGDHFVYCGTLTMSEPEWEGLRGHLEHALSDDFEVDDPRHMTAESRN